MQSLFLAQVIMEVYLVLMQYHVKTTQANVQQDHP